MPTLPTHIYMLLPTLTRLISLGTTIPTYLQLLPTDMEMLTMALPPPTCSRVPPLISPMGSRLAEEDTATPLPTIDMPDIPTTLDINLMNVTSAFMVILC